MLPLYEDFNDTLKVFHRKSRHISPHLHKSIEFVYVTNGTLELGIGRELFHMETGDFAIIFPDTIHHYQVFDTAKCTAMHVMISPVLCAGYEQTLQQFCPDNPVIPAKKLHKDIPYALENLRKFCKGSEQHTLYFAYTQIIFARSLPLYRLVDKNTQGNDDIIYNTVTYIAKHFRESVTLTSMATDLGYSPYALSRVFSSTFHRNFNQYLNETRVEYAHALLLYTNQTIMEVLENSGFESQRTFNRVFKEKYRISPREYRRLHKQEAQNEKEDL